MGTRTKTFDSTGLATNGRLYAGDLNAIQDDYADLSNYSQQVDVAALSIGESALKLLRYGVGEARISGLLRIDGILRGLGGLFAGTFTTTQRDAIAAGSRPYGLIILNSTTNRLEWNAGTDAAPNWQPISDSAGTVPIGSTIDWPWVHTQLPANYLLAYGQAVPRASYPALNALASASGYPHGNGDGSTTFNLPDFRGRASFGRDDMGGTAINRVTSGGSGILGTTLGASGGAQNVALASGEMPAHNHTVTGAPARTGSVVLAGNVSNGSIAATAGTLSLPNHIHGITDPGHSHGGVKIPGGTLAGQGNPELTDGSTSSAYTGINNTNNPTTNPGINGAPGISGTITNGTLAVTDTIAVTIGTLATANAGGGAAHNNMPPAIIVNVAMRVS